MSGNERILDWMRDHKLVPESECQNCATEEMGDCPRCFMEYPGLGCPCGDLCEYCADPEHPDDVLNPWTIAFYAILMLNRAKREEPGLAGRLRAAAARIMA